MSNLRHDEGVLVRFWSLDHHRAEPVLWPESPWPKLVYCLEGVLEVESKNRLYILPPNRAIWVEAEEPHPAKTLGRAKVRTLYFSPDMRIRRMSGLLSVEPLLRELIADACLTGPLRSSHSRSDAIASLLRFEIEYAPSLAIGVVLPRTPWLREWAQQFLAYPLEWPRSNWSRRTLERQLLKETGLTLGQWCQQARTLIAVRALSCGATVLEAGVEAGYASSSGFIQAFKRQFGTTPGRTVI